MQKLFFKIFQLLSKVIGGRGLRQLPWSSRIYQSFYRWLRPKGVVELRVQSLSVRINASDPGIAPWLLMGKEFSPLEIRFLERTLKPGMIFVDVGANVGYFSLLAAGRVGPTGRVYAFEPDNANFVLLEQNIIINNLANVVAVKKAISDRAGGAKLYLDNQNPCRHSLTPNASQSFQEVETISLDDFFLGGNNKVDVIKIDVEGAEPAVLAGMKKIIEDNPRLALMTEFYPKALERFGVSPHAYLDNLVAAGFTLQALKDNGRLEPFDRHVPVLKLINLIGFHSDRPI